MTDSQFRSVLLDLVPRLRGRSNDHKNGDSNRVFGRIGILIRRCIFSILSIGPLPNHIAFIMDGNRRYARKNNLKEGDGHRVGFLALMSLLKYCYELNVNYITIYAFSIENFKRKPEQVQFLMELMQEKLEGLLKEESLVMKFGVRVQFIGNLKLLSKKLQSSIFRVMKATENNTKAVLLVCVAYTSSDEIVHAIEESVQDKRKEFAEIKVDDVERSMYMDVAPDPDILIRSSGESRLSNFVLWQTANCLLYCPSALWPELGLWHLVWSVMNFQRHHGYLEKKRKQA